MNRDYLLKGLAKERILFGMFFAFGNRLQSAGDKFYEDITCKQFFLLMCLSLFHEEAPTINQLAQVMGSSHQNVKVIATKLEEKGYLKLVIDEKDKRKLRVQLTNKREKISKQYQQQEQMFMKQLYKGIKAEDVQTTLTVIQAMENNLLEMEK